jgi:hypothetical protein
MNTPKSRSQFGTFVRFLKKYFHDYGGLPAVIGSPLFITSLAISLVSYQSWIDESWPDLAMSVIPNLLGFSLGTYALLFSLISPRIRLALRTLRNDKGVRYIDEMNATFLHFILVQVICFIWAFLYKQSLFLDISLWVARTMPSNVNLFPVLSTMGGIVGVLLILYSILLVIGASLTVYRIAKIVDPDQS